MTLPWDRGDLWNVAAALGYGARAAIVTSQKWKDDGGYSHGTMRNRGSVCARFPKLSRHDDILSYEHHVAVMCLADDAQAHAVLYEAERRGWSASEAKVEAQKILHGFYVRHGTDAATSLNASIQNGERFPTLVVDPAWEFHLGPGIRGGVDTRYHTMTYDQIEALPIGQVATQNATLFLWVPECHLEQSFKIIRAWGFEPRGTIIWRKTGNLGNGSRTRQIHEYLRIGVRPGSPWFDGAIPSVVDAARGPHSEKPQIFFDLIERATPGPRLELFARRRRKGWKVVGDQVSDEPPIEPTEPDEPIKYGVQTILQGNCLDVLKTREAESVQMVCSSPPYYNLRDYGTAQWVGGDPDCQHNSDEPCSDPKMARGLQEANVRVRPGRDHSHCRKCGAARIDQQLGMENSPEEYVANVVAVCREVWPVLKDDGVMFLNIGDSFSNRKRVRTFSHQPGLNGFEEGSWADAAAEGRCRMSIRSDDLKEKDLIGIPWMVAFALRADGWYLRSDIIWAKANPIPESVKDRPTRSHEYVFLLAKSKTYYYDRDAIREPPSGRTDPISGFGACEDRRDTGRVYEKDELLGSDPTTPEQVAAYLGNPPTNLARCGDNADGMRNSRDVWTINTQAYRGAHFATMPVELAEKCIKAGSKVGDVVLDPFAGIGTTGYAAQWLGRDALLIELNADYVRMAEDRLRML